MKITKRHAAFFMLMKQGLIGDYRYSGKEGILGFTEEAGCVQFDPVDVCGKNHELVYNSRIRDFKREDLYSLLYKDRKLIELYVEPLMTEVTRFLDCHL